MAWRGRLAPLLSSQLRCWRVVPSVPQRRFSVAPEFIEQAKVLQKLDYQEGRNRKTSRKMRKARLRHELKAEVMQERAEMVTVNEDQISKMIKVAKLTKYGTAKLREIERLFSRMKPLASPSLWNELIGMFCQKGLQDKVDGLLDDMKELQLEPDLETFEILYQNFEVADDVLGMMKVVTDMEVGGHQPSGVMFESLLELTGQHRPELQSYFDKLLTTDNSLSPNQIHLTIAWLSNDPANHAQLFEFFKDLLANPGRLNPDISMYHRLLFSFRQKGDYAMPPSQCIEQLLTRLQAAGIPVLRDGFHAAIQRAWGGFEPDEDSLEADFILSELEATLKLMQQHGITQTLTTYEVLIEMLVGRAELDAAFGVLASMQEKGYGVGPAIPAVLVQGFLVTLKVESDSISLENILAFIEKMEQLGVRHVILYDTILQELESLNMNRSLSGQRSAESREGLENTIAELLMKMKQQKLRPSINTFAIMIGICAQLGDVQGMASHVRELRRLGLAMDTMTCRALIHGFCRVGRYEACMKMFLINETMKGAPPPSLYQPVLLSYTRLGQTEDAEGLLLTMLTERYILPSERHWGDVISGWVTEGRVDRAIQLYTKMRDPTTYAVTPGLGLIKRVTAVLSHLQDPIGEPDQLVQTPAKDLARKINSLGAGVVPSAGGGKGGPASLAAPLPLVQEFEELLLLAQNRPNWGASL